MIPFWMILKKPKQDGTTGTWHFPLIFVWCLLLALLLPLLPLWVLVSLALYAAGWGWTGFAVLALFIETLWQLRGLKIDIESKNEKIYMHFI